MARFITTYTLKDGQTVCDGTYNLPDLINYVCPHCGSYPMTYYKVDMGEWDGYKTVCKCVMCYSEFEEGDKRLTETPSPIENDKLYNVVCETIPITSEKRTEKNNITPKLFNNFTSLKYFKTLDYKIISIDSEAIILHNADDAKGITLSIQPTSKRTYYSDSCLSGENGGLSRDELKALYLFWEEYDEKVEIYINEGSE